MNFLANKSLGTVHIRKNLILCRKSSINSKKNYQKLSLLVPKTFLALNMHLIISIDLLLDHKILNLKDLEIIKGPG
jgi:hypothetical protein